MKRSPAALAILLPALLAGCIQNHGPSATEIRSLADLDAELAKRRDAVKDMTANISMKVEGLEHSGSLSGVLNCEPPAKFRMDAYKRLTVTLFVFTMVEGRFLINVVAEDKWVRGEVKGQEQKHPELTAAFAWLDERLEPGDQRALEEDPADRIVVATRRNGRVVRRTTYERSTLFATRISLFGADGAECATVELSNYRRVRPPEARPGPDAWIPWTIVVRGKNEEGKDYRVETGMSRVYINEGIEPEVWKMEIPEGATVEDAK